MKKREPEVVGEDVNEAIEMVGWGVEEAQKAHKEEASMLYTQSPHETMPFSKGLKF